MSGAMVRPDHLLRGVTAWILISVVKTLLDRAEHCHLMEHKDSAS